MHIIGLWEEAVVPRQNSGFILGLSAPCCCQTDCNNRGGKCDWGHFWSKWLFAYFTTSNMQRLEEQLLRTRKTQTATCVKLLATIKDNMSYVASSLKNKKLTVMIWFNRKIKIFNPTNQDQDKNTNSGERSNTRKVEITRTKRNWLQVVTRPSGK